MSKRKKRGMGRSRTSGVLAAATKGRMAKDAEDGTDEAASAEDVTAGGGKGGTESEGGAANGAPPEGSGAAGAGDGDPRGTGAPDAGGQPSKGGRGGADAGAAQQDGEATKGSVAEKPPADGAAEDAVAGSAGSGEKADGAGHGGGASIATAASDPDAKSAGEGGAGGDADRAGADADANATGKDESGDGKARGVAGVSEDEVEAIMRAEAPAEDADAPFVAPQRSILERLTMPGTPAAAGPAALANPKADIAALETLERHLYAHRYAEIGIECASGSIDPEAATMDSGEALAILRQEDHELLGSETTGALLERLEGHGQLLSETQRAQVRILKRDRAALVNVPASEQAAFTRLTSKALFVWRRAKAASDWESFAPFLDRIVAALRSIAAHRRPGADPYDVWLDEHEHGADRAFYDAFFKRVRECVVPLVVDISARGRHPSRRVIEGRFDVRRQWALARDLMALQGLDGRRVFLTETEHPYSDALTSNYAVIATHVYEDDVCSNVFSMLHEGGHALYELGVNPTYNYTSLKGGTSMGMHEAQSRFFENYVGHAEAFVPVLLAALRAHFPGQFGRVTTRQLYLATNRAEPGLLRTEADELTYPLHVLVRYEIEQLLMAGEARAADVPGLWAKKYRDYLGVEVPDDAHGALQDVHWSEGALGYFPTYALGGAFGAQLKAAMVAGGLDFDGALAAGDLSPISAWLRERIWRFGRARDSGELIEGACGEPFDATYYTDYLVGKFSAIYGL